MSTTFPCCFPSTASPLRQYVLHRFVFHMDEWISDSPNAITAHFLMHGCHHKVPNDRYRLVMPPVAAIVLYFVCGSLTRLLTLPFLHTLWVFWVFWSGNVFGYVAYDLTHYATHHGNFHPSSYLGSLRKYHLRHHYNNQFNVGFGITSKLWDMVFGTVLPLDDKGK